MKMPKQAWKALARYTALNKPFEIWEVGISTNEKAAFHGMVHDGLIREVTGEAYQKVRDGLSVELIAMIDNAKGLLEDLKLREAKGVIDKAQYIHGLLDDRDEFYEVTDAGRAALAAHHSRVAKRTAAIAR